MNRYYEKFIERFAMFIILLAGIAVMGFFMVDGRNTSSQNNGYVRVINCIISVPATERTSVDIDNCYASVENDIGIKLQRYNEAKK